MNVKFENITLNEAAQPLKSFTIEGKNFVLSEHAINAKNALIRQNKNLQTIISFEIERTHKSSREAQIFAMTHAQTLNMLDFAPLSFANVKTNNIFLCVNNATISSVKTTVEEHLTISKYIFLGTL